MFSNQLSSFAHAVLLPARMPIVDVTDAAYLGDVLPDITVHRTGYPYPWASKPIRLNLTMHERQNLMGYMMKAIQLFHTKGQSLQGETSTWRQRP